MDWVIKSQRDENKKESRLLKLNWSIEELAAETWGLAVNIKTFGNPD